MKVEPERSEFADLANLDRCPSFEAEPLVKNAHTATHLRIFDNSIAFLALDHSLYIYSLAHMARDKPPLLNIIHLKDIFQEHRKQHFQDKITSVFGQVEKEDFSSLVFEGEQGSSSNILLKAANLKGRVKYFNNSNPTLQSLHINDQGQALLLLRDGRGAVVSHSSPSWHNHHYSTIDLNELAKEKISQVCFASPQLVCLFTQDRLSCYDHQERAKILSHKITAPNPCQLHAHPSEKDRFRVYLVCSFKILVMDVLKKKIASTQVVSFDCFISQCFFHPSCFFAVTPKAITRIQNSGLQKTTFYSFQEPSQLLQIDCLGNFTKKPSYNNRQCLHLLESTSNGVFLGLTIRKQGNYKEGRLVVFETPQRYYLARLIANLREPQPLNIGDSLFVPTTKENKEILVDFARQESRQEPYRQHIRYLNFELSPQEYSIVSINIGHAFQGKESARQKIIEKTLNSQFENKVPLRKKLNFIELQQRCCFSGAVLFDEDLDTCEQCCLFAIKGKGSKCPVCLGKMKPLE